MAGMADENEFVVLSVIPGHLLVYLKYQRAGGVNGLEPTLPGLLPNRLGPAVGAEEHRHPIGDVREFLHKNRALGPKRLHHMSVVDDLVAHIDRGSEDRQRPLDRKS